MITFFSIPKPFTGHIGVIQKNALRSWRRAIPDCEIILFGDEEGIHEAAKDVGAIHIKDIEKNEYGTPYLDTIFTQVNSLASNSMICYSNSDIIFDVDMSNVICNVKRNKYLLIGRRRDIDIEIQIDNSIFQSEISRLKDEGKLCTLWAIDFFIFSKGQIEKMPHFLVGRAGWDNWMIFNARFERIPVIDCTESLIVLHQNHDHKHVKKARNIFYGPESDYNLSLLRSKLFSIADADYIMTNGSIRKKRRTLVDMSMMPLILNKQLWINIENVPILLIKLKHKMDGVASIISMNRR